MDRGKVSLISTPSTSSSFTTTTTTRRHFRRHFRRRDEGFKCIYASSLSPKIVVVAEGEQTTTTSKTTTSKYEVTEKVKIGSKRQVQLDVRSGRLYAQALEKTATLKVNGNVCFPGVAYVIKPEGALCEIGSQGEDEVGIFNVSLENANTNATASADAMSEMLAKSFEMTASKEVQNALKVEKVIAAKKLAIHTKDMDLPPSSSSSRSSPPPSKADRRTGMTSRVCPNRCTRRAADPPPPRRPDADYRTRSWLLWYGWAPATAPGYKTCPRADPLPQTADRRIHEAFPKHLAVDPRSVTCAASLVPHLI